MEILGIDIGGSGIKGAPVDTVTGSMLASRHRIPTPDPGKPQQVADVIAEIIHGYNWKRPVGCGFPGVVINGVTRTAANIHPGWIDLDAAALLSDRTGLPVTVINDADAAGIAEMTFGAGKGRRGTVLLVTIGTGLGSALFHNGQLLPNTEFGHLKIRGKDAEARASDAIRKEKELSWKKWAKRLNEFLLTMESLVWPDLIILGGGVSKEADNFIPQLTVRAQVVPAQLRNEAGIIGAALAAFTHVKVAEAT